ncbi:phosphatidate cytidylyltransferase [Temperatibacter marinus]|uniref:Phosphatidate cytidylyltransferase n=1 Tax=Temperatibacter marinus TaxID=1456591 RepID=A0AA52EEX4_9PROT|nr:phosphatidate cytidylyltransferase [Temperatibacter marinus]WND02383.1 phosphatidate cytidylyltransferase [Temperatibacter marinus]
MKLSENLLKRIFGALILLPPVLWLLYQGGLWFTGLLMVAGVVMATEWHEMTRVRPLLIRFSSMAFVLAACLFGNLLNQLTPISTFIAAMAIPLVLVLTSLKDLDEYKSPILHIMRWSGNGTLYVALPLMSMAWIRGIDDGALFVLWTFLIVWAADVGGYFFGKGIGGAKLAPTISPKKTWAGFIGGSFLAVAVTWVLVIVIGDQRLYEALFVALCLSILSQIGDLFESAIKRAFQVKDSGTIIPGHGGILDRVDGLVFAAPAMAVILDIYVVN